ncbi:phospholipase D family protein [Rossellomorea marisflavi]|uniref:phospholipase D family protein n=1 Tax=Rossellomorea marisflavi TaxID=189381 RepID=UPI003D2D1526
MDENGILYLIVLKILCGGCLNMSVNFLNQNIGKEYLSLLESTNNSIYIMSPFISFSTANQLSTWLEEENGKITCKIITRFNREEFIQGANSLKGIERLFESGIEIYALQHLHSKLYLFDKSSCIMGSANFTLSGFFKNHELGIILKDEKHFTKQCVDYFEDTLEKIQQCGDFRITREALDKEFKYVSQSTSGLGKMKKDSNPKEFNQHRWGAVLDKKENERQSDFQYKFEEHFDILNSASSEYHNIKENVIGGRIKFEGNGHSRIPNTEIYIERKKKNYQFMNRTFFHRRPSSIKEGEIIFIAQVSKDRHGIDTPIIVGYAVSHAYKDGNLLKKNDPRFHKWNEDYPHYIEFSNGKFLKTPIVNGISLIELGNELKHKLYPGTETEPDTPLTDISKRHHQKAHIQITREATQYLITRLDRLFQEQGYDKI